MNKATEEFLNFLIKTDDNVYDFEDPPIYLKNEVCLTFWYLSKNVRDVLTSPAWRDRVKKGIVPYFCLFNGFCRYFETKSGLDSHLYKNPGHKLINFISYQKEAEKRIEARHAKFKSKACDDSSPRRSRSPTPSSIKSVSSNSSSSSLTQNVRRRIYSGSDEDFPDKHYISSSSSDKRFKLKKPPSPTCPHPDDCVEDLVKLDKAPPQKSLTDSNLMTDAVSSDILEKLNLSMPKPDYLWSSPNVTSMTSKVSGLGNPRDPRKRKPSICSFLPTCSPPEAKVLKIVSPTNSSSSPPTNSGPKMKISLAQYMSTNYSPGLKEALPELPAANELFSNDLVFEPEQGIAQVPIRKEEVAEKKTVDEFEKLEGFLKKKSSRVSSWTVSRTNSRGMSLEELSEPAVPSSTNAKTMQPEILNEPDKSQIVTDEDNVDNFPVGCPGIVSDDPEPQTVIDETNVDNFPIDCPEIVRDDPEPQTVIDEDNVENVPVDSPEIVCDDDFEPSLEKSLENANVTTEESQPNESQPIVVISEDVFTTVELPTSPSQASGLENDLVTNEEVLTTMELPTSPSLASGLENDSEARSPDSGFKEITHVEETPVELLDKCPPEAFIVEDPGPTSVVQVEVESLPTELCQDESTVVLIKGVSNSIDFCSSCSTKLCPFRGGYSVNCTTFDVSLVCHGCAKKVIIKGAFNTNQKSVLWMSSV